MNNFLSKIITATKNIFKHPPIWGAWGAVFVALLMLLSCSLDYTTYDGPEYVMFSDTLYTLPVQDETTIFEIPVASTVKTDHDRTFGIEILDRRSTAIEGKHYDILSTSVTIPAGEMATRVQIRGRYSDINYGDSLRLTLRLVGDQRTLWNLYPNETAVMLKKCCPYDIHQFEGWALMTSTFLMSYATSSKKLVKIELDPDNPNGIICRDYFYEGYDCRMTLDATNPLDPVVTVPDQVFAGTAQAFGTIYGDGKILMTSPSGHTSFFNTCQGFIAHYMYLTVDGVGSVGLFLNVLEMISDDEAQRYF